MIPIINKASLWTFSSSKDAVPNASLSAKKLKFMWIRVLTMEITILLMSQAKIQIAATMKQSQSNITAFEKSSFYEERDFFTIYY